jgi:hypothetical protein
VVPQRRLAHQFVDGAEGIEAYLALVLAFAVATEAMILQNRQDLLLINGRVIVGPRSRAETQDRGHPWEKQAGRHWHGTPESGKSRREETSRSGRFLHDDTPPL